MGNRKTLTLTYMGRDSWDRPVYRDENGTIWKDTDPVKETDRKPPLYTTWFNKFCTEPEVSIYEIEEYKKAKLTFLPKRDLWH